MEWAYAYGYSKKYASASRASYERHFARWAEAAGYDLDFFTQHDLQANPNLLNDHACAIVVGQDEYWSARCAMQWTPMSPMAGMWRSLLATFCGRPGSKIRGDLRSVTNTSPIRTRCTTLTRHA